MRARHRGGGAGPRFRVAWSRGFREDSEGTFPRLSVKTGEVNRQTSNPVVGRSSLVVGKIRTARASSGIPRTGKNTAPLSCILLFFSPDPAQERSILHFQADHCPLIPTPPVRNTRSCCEPSTPCAALKYRWCDTGRRARNFAADTRVRTGCEGRPESERRHRQPAAVG